MGDPLAFGILRFLKHIVQAGARVTRAECIPFFSVRLLSRGLSIDDVADPTFDTLSRMKPKWLYLTLCFIAVPHGGSFVGAATFPLSPGIAPGAHVASRRLIACGRASCENETVRERFRRGNGRRTRKRHHSRTTR